MQIAKVQAPEGIDLTTSHFSLEKLTDIQSRINTLFQTLTNREHYLNNHRVPETFFAPVKDLFEPTMFQKLSAGTPLQSAIDTIFFEENRFFQEANVIAYTQSSTTQSVDIEVVSVNDSELYQIESLRITLDDQMRISDVEQLSAPYSAEFPTRPLSTDPLLDGGHTPFIGALESLLKQLNLSSLRNAVLDGADETTNFHIETLFHSLKFPESDFEALMKLFLSGILGYEGTTVDSYKVTDRDGLAQSIYTINIPTTHQIHRFECYFSRLTGEIANLTYLGTKAI